MEYDDCIATTTTAKKTNRQHLKLDANRELCAPISVWMQRPTRLQCKQCTMIIKTEMHTSKQESDVWENNSAKHRKKGHNGPMIWWRVENNFNSMFETECFHLCCTLTHLLYRIASGLGSSSPSHWSILPYSWQNINNTTASMTFDTDILSESGANIGVIATMHPQHSDGILIWCRFLLLFALVVFVFFSSSSPFLLCLLFVII